MLPRFNRAISQIVGKRLTLAQLTGKVGRNGNMLILTV